MVRNHRWIGGALALALTVASAIHPVWAVQTLEELDDPITVQLQTSLSAESTQVGQDFTAVLTEDVRYQQWVIPQGTVFRGDVVKARTSKPFSRAGYLLLQVESATLPNGSTYNFFPEAHEPRRKKLTHPDARTFKDTVKEQIPYTAVTLGTSLPLRYGADMNRWVVLPITIGARMVLGAGMALFDDDLADKNVVQRLGYGMWQGTGVPRIYRFVTKEPNPSFVAGDSIPLYFNETALETFFKSADLPPAQTSESAAPEETGALTP